VAERGSASRWRSRRLLLIVGALIVVAAVAVTAGVREKADTRKDAQVRAGLTTIREAIYAYSKDHTNFVPPPEEVTAAGLKAWLPPGVAWPLNPFTGQPMHAGSGSGDYQYKTLGPNPSSGYTIDGYGADGRSVW